MAESRLSRFLSSGNRETPERVFSPATYDKFHINLKEQDGTLHVLCREVSQHSKYRQADLEDLFAVMQRDGYQIVDILSNSKVYEGTTDRFEFTIIYK